MKSERTKLMKDQLTGNDNEVKANQRPDGNVVSATLALILHQSRDRGDAHLVIMDVYP